MTQQTSIKHSAEEPVACQGEGACRLPARQRHETLEGEAWLEGIANLQARLHYRFKHLDLLKEALTHSTYRYEHATLPRPCNERLEFLGDSVLGLTMCRALFEALPEESEGRLSLLKARLVCEPTLSNVAHDLGLGPLLLLGRGEDATGGRQKPSNLSNAVEAIYGAILQDSDFETAAQVVCQTLRPYFEEALAGHLIYDYKTLLLEKIQTVYNSSDLSFRLLEAHGPAHRPEFTIGIYLKEHFLGQGSGANKKEATQVAAKQAIAQLDRLNVLKDH